MNIVLDTNVLVSGLLSPFGPCGEIVRMVSSAELTLDLDARILSEYEEVLQRPKFRFDADKIDALLAHLEHRGRTVATSPLTMRLPDLDDEPFLEVAIAAKSVCIVTGNRIHFPPDLCRGVGAFSPGDFLAYYRNNPINQLP